MPTHPFIILHSLMKSYIKQKKSYTLSPFSSSDRKDPRPIDNYEKAKRKIVRDPTQTIPSNPLDFSWQSALFADKNKCTVVLLF